jgi:hypothetical protein
MRRGVGNRRRGHRQVGRQNGWSEASNQSAARAAQCAAAGGGCGPRYAGTPRRRDRWETSNLEFCGGLRYRGPRLRTSLEDEDLAWPEMLLLARAHSGQPALAAMRQRHQRVPPPGRGKKANSFYRMRLLTRDPAARPRQGRGGLDQADSQRGPPRARRSAVPARRQQCQPTGNRAHQQGTLSDNVVLQGHR